jgi:NitT/TauT family transport system permease protein
MRSNPDLSATPEILTGTTTGPEVDKELSASAPRFAVPYRGNRRVRLIPALFALVLAGLAWQLLSQSGLVAAYLLPSPQKVFNSWLHLLNTGTLWKHVSATLMEALLGFLAAFVVSVSLGYFIARSAWLSWLLAPFIAATQAMPMIALAPILVMWFGLGLSSKIIICGLIVFFPILVNTVIGLRNIDREMLDAACNQGANAWQSFCYIEVPLALRTLLGGIRMGLTLSLTGAIVGEFVASDSGLGFLMMLSRVSYDSSMLFASSLTMAGLAVICYLLIGFLEHILIDW